MKQLASSLIWIALLLGVAALGMVKLSAVAVNRVGEWAFEKEVKA